MLPPTAINTPSPTHPHPPAPSRQSKVTEKEDKLNVSMCGLGPYLRALATRKGTTPAALIRSVVSRMLDEEATSLEDSTTTSTPKDCLVSEVRVSLSSPQALALASRARASGVSRSQYFRALLDGDPPPALPADHASLISALLTSTDRLAATCVDLNAFLRLLNSLPSTQVDGYRASLRSLISDVRAHLTSAAAVLAEVKQRRPR